MSYKPGDFELAVRRSKTGLGLYAVSPIPKGACVIEYVGVQITAEQEATSRSKYLFEVNARKTIDGAPRWNTARYINHSCRPNCEPNIYKARVFVHAKRTIKPGEELTYNYGKNYFNQYLKEICACAKCKPDAPAKGKAPGAKSAKASAKKAPVRPAMTKKRPSRRR